jgi:two-component system sensor histidine kinase BaeS
MAHMNSLLGKTLLAMLASTVLALLLVSTIQRGGFKKGLGDFLKRQEEVQLSYLVPELQSLYRRTGSWDGLREEPRRWLRLLAKTRPEGVAPPEDALQEGPVAKERRRGDRADHRIANPTPSDLRQLWRRMFLLDAEKQWVAGAPALKVGKELASNEWDDGDQGLLQAIEVNGDVVGWVGFVAARQPTSPEAQRFMLFQRNTLLLSALIALVASTLLGFLLARNLSRPVVALRNSVQSLTAGDYSVRTETRGGDEIASLGRNINRMAESLQANESARRRWTADVAHELRTPIAILQAEIEAARDGIRPNMEATLDSLREEVLHLSGLVNDLQTLALADAGALNLKLADTDLSLMTRQVLDAMSERIGRSGLTLETQLPDSLVVQADAQRIRQLLLNLMENACRYTDAPGQIRIQLRETDSGVEWLIEDSPPGLQPGQLDQLFDRFYRAEGSRGRAGGGSGLGLSICEKIVHAHGGTILARSSQLGGLAIVVTLPVGA